MRKYVLTFLFMIMSMMMTSCVSTEELAYSDVYVSAGITYPVVYINSYPYYWFEGHWTIVPTYRYRYIRPLDRPRHFYAPRPNPHKYNYRYYPGPRDNRHQPHRPSQHRPDVRPNHPQGRPHTLQPNGPRNNGNHNSRGHFGGRR